MPKIPTALWALLAEHMDDFDDEDLIEHGLAYMASVTSKGNQPFLQDQVLGAPRWV